MWSPYLWGTESRYVALVIMFDRWKDFINSFYKFKGELDGNHLREGMEYIKYNLFMLKNNAVITSNSHLGLKAVLQYCIRVLNAP